MTNPVIKLKPTDIMEDGKLKAIEYTRVDNGKFEFQAMWDDREEHTPENIAEFRVWCCRMATRLNYELVEE